MTPESRKHDQGHAELVFLHALQALPVSEIPRLLQARISACAECRQEREMLRPILETFVAWPTDVLRPPESLWERLSQRIAAETREAPSTSTCASPRPVEPEWEEAAPGISVKLLATDPESDRVSMLVRLALGAAYPPHRHAGVEELYLLHGELMIDERKLYPGDYNRAEANTVDHRVWSEHGCTCLCPTSTRDVLH